MTKVVFKLVRLGEQGHNGAHSALEALREVFLEDIGGDRHGADKEFQRGVNGAIGKALAEPTREHDKGCCPPTQAERDKAFAQYAESDGGQDHADGMLPDDPYQDRPEPASEEPKRRLRLTPLSAIKPRPVRWAWTDRIPAGELTLTPGRGGLGKSTFHAWIIAHLTRGTLPGVHFGKAKPCIIAASEDSYDRTIVPRLIAAGADMDLVYRVDVITETSEEVSISPAARHRSANRRDHQDRRRAALSGSGDVCSLQWARHP
jgi:hypothetical protein